MRRQRWPVAMRLGYTTLIRLKTEAAAEGESVEDRLSADIREANHVR